MYRYTENNNYRIKNVVIQNDGGVTSLKWDNTPGCGILIIKGGLGRDVLPEMNRICEFLGNTDIQHLESREGFFALDGEEEFLFISIQKNMSCGSQMSVFERGRYTFFIYKVIEGAVEVYKPLPGMGSYFQDISMTITVKIQEEYKKEKTGILGTREELVPTGFYSVSFLGECNSSQYEDGELYYEVGSIKIPITRKMIEQKRIFIRTEEKPRLIADNEGIKVVETDE